jgi:hypothetical protein
MTASEFQKLFGAGNVRQARKGEGGTRLPKLQTPNKLEAEWISIVSKTLDSSTLYEPFSFNLPDGTKYTPDVVVFSQEERGLVITCYEVKGPFEHNDRWKLKFKAARAAFPIFNFAIAKKTDTGEWIIISD